MALPAILQMLSGQTMNGSPQMPQLGQLRQMISMMKNAGDPQALFQQMMQQNNPGLAKAMDYVKQHGGDAKSACEALAKEKGINLHDLGL